MEKEVKKGSEGSQTGKEIQSVTPTHAISPFEDVDRMFDTMFEGFMPRGWMRPFRREWPMWGESAMPLRTRIPKVDIIDRDDEVVVRAEVPGIDKDDLDVTVSENRVTIKGETKREEKEEKGDYLRCEISRGEFSRTVALPHYVDSDAAKARFSDGVLELTMPKVEKAKRHSIKIE